MNRIGNPFRHYLPDVTLLAMAVAALLLVVSYDGAGVFGGPDSCQQPQAIRDALENATGLACAEIGSADLKDIRVLDLRGELFYGDSFASGYSFRHRIHKLQLGAFNGLERLELLDLRGNRLTGLPPGVFDGLENLRVLNLSSQVTSLNRYGRYLAPDEASAVRLALRRGLTELPPGVFESLTNLEILDLQGNGGAPFTITHPNADLDCLGCVVVPP